MSQKIVIRSFLMFPLIFLLCISSLYAGISGKITGIVTDSEYKEVLPGVNVILEGTQIGAATDEQGRFIILNVSPGVYTLKMSMIGYTGTRIENVRVRIDLTTTVNAELRQTVLESSETVTIVAERPLVQKDMKNLATTVKWIPLKKWECRFKRD